MKIYFPQWQGSGTGQNIETGAATVLKYVADADFEHIPLSNLPSGLSNQKKYHINNYAAITEQLMRLKDHLAKKQPKTLQIIGGDCGLEIVPVSYLNQKYSNLGVIWFDAHADINRPCDSASCNFHGMPLRTLLGEGEEEMEPLLFEPISEDQIHYVGLRDIDPEEQLRIDKGNIYHPKTVDIEDLIATLKSKNIKQLYVHFDFDCLDPLDYDKTYYQVPHGVKIKEAENCIKALQQNFKVVGSSVLESITTHTTELQPIKNIINLLMT